MIQVFWRADALEDFDEAFHWYEEQRPGLGLEFARDLDSHIERLPSFPRAFPVVFEGLRRAILKRFPFGLYYLLEDERIVVFGVLHLKRDILRILDRRRFC